MTLSNMVSKCKLIDKAMLMEISDTILLVAKIPTAQATEVLKALAVTYEMYDNRVKHKDYTQDDYLESIYEQTINATLCPH